MFLIISFVFLFIVELRNVSQLIIVASLRYETRMHIFSFHLLSFPFSIFLSVSFPLSLSFLIHIVFLLSFKPALSVATREKFNRCQKYRRTFRRYSDRCCSPSMNCRCSLFAVYAASRTETPQLEHLNLDLSLYH